MMDDLSKINQWNIFRVELYTLVRVSEPVFCLMDEGSNSSDVLFDLSTAIHTISDSKLENKLINSH